jgi:hypothetical protein
MKWLFLFLFVLVALGIVLIGNTMRANYTDSKAACAAIGAEWRGTRGLDYCVGRDGIMREVPR